MGEGEKLVRALFAVARELQPSVIFIGLYYSISGVDVPQTSRPDLLTRFQLISKPFFDAQMKWTACFVKGGRENTMPLVD